MLKEVFSKSSRVNKVVEVDSDLVVAGGGLSGVCAAITAARAGINVVLVQDRPVLGGNASSEVRLWALGATSHMGNNNRWSREGGVIDEIMLENLHCNREGNPLIFDTVLLDKIVQEKNITLLLNTAVHQVNKSAENHIDSIEAFCSQNSINYLLKAPLFCDATGDGLVAFNAGAAFRVGAESREEFGEKLAAPHESKELLGHTLFFYSKQTENPVTYIPPSFAHREISTIPRFKILNEKDDGCRLWWLEYGGNSDTVYDTEEIKWELWRVVYGAWDHIKNSGQFDDVENLTLEWVGTVPGKRESRRFEGEYMLRQQDVVEQREFDDAVSYGGWAVDIHPGDGIYSEEPPCSQWHSKGVYQIPYRCFISRDIDNLFFAGRNISASHIAFGSSRVMITCAHGGQAVGAAAALCNQLGVLPAKILDNGHIRTLQHNLNLTGQSIPGMAIEKSSSPVAQANIIPSSTLALSEILADGPWHSLSTAVAQLLPMQPDVGHTYGISVRAAKATNLVCELRASEKAANYTPDQVLKTISLPIAEGEQQVVLDFSDITLKQQYTFLLFAHNDDIQIRMSEQRMTGLCSVFNKVHAAVSNNGFQSVSSDIGIEEFEFWTPQRRPMGHNLAMTLDPPLALYDSDNLRNGFTRPWLQSNAWAAELSDSQPSITLEWPQSQLLNGVILFFDGDFDHALETVLMGHPEYRVPFCVQKYRIKLADGTVLHEQVDNYQSINRIVFEQPVACDKLIIELDHPSVHVPASLFEVECF